MIGTAQKLWSDIVGIVSAILCIAHCLVLPLFLSTTVFQGNHYWHFTFIILSFIGVLASALHTKVIWIKVTLMVSFAALLFGSIFGFSILENLGIAGLVITHFINIYLVQVSKNKKALAIN